MVARWLFHVVPRHDLRWSNDRYAPPSLEREGFIHASYRDAVVESARLYFPGVPDLVVLVIDPRLLDVRVDVAITPRGPMPHLVGSIARAAVREITLGEVAGSPDEVDRQSPSER